MLPVVMFLSAVATKCIKRNPCCKNMSTRRNSTCIAKHRLKIVFIKKCLMNVIPLVDQNEQTMQLYTALHLPELDIFMHSLLKNELEEYSSKMSRLTSILIFL